MFYFSLGFVLMLFVVIAGLSFSLNEATTEKQNLAVKLNTTTAEMEKVKQDYLVLQQEAFTVQQSIEEFKQLEERITNLSLDMPIDLDPDAQDGSGGLQFPKQYEEEQVQQTSPMLEEIKRELPELIEKFEDAFTRLSQYEQDLRTVPTIIPAEGRITSRFGNRRDPFNWSTRFHSGIDIAAPLNTPIYAAADGTVVMARNNGGYGLTVVIDHGSTYETLYAHLNRIDVEVGDKVKKGDTIGGMGTTGRSTGVHLHYEIKRDGEHIDPYLYMTFHERSQ